MKSALYHHPSFRIFTNFCLGAIMFLASDSNLVPALHGQETLPSLKIRFTPNADGEIATQETPDFQKHISPLLGRLGCNGRACHGSFQGQGGFMLSLFGYDFDLDHKALLDEQRVTIETPLSSLILTKPTSDSMHEGGKRYEHGKWEFQVLKKWIEAGAKKKNTSPNEDLHIQKLQITPTEITFDISGKQAPLTAIAFWNDGSSENVTELSRFFSNDSAIASVDEFGMVTGHEKGDTHVVVSYDNAVVPVRVLCPNGPPGQLQSEIARASNSVDRLVLTKLDKLGIIPSPVASDEEFFRRVSLDVAGTLPTSTKVREFLDDRDPNKRTKALEQLLNSPGYAALWATFLCDITGNNEEQLNNFSYARGTQSQHWYQWIYDRVARNVPYDQIVDGLVTAVSREPNESYREYCDKMTAIANDKSGKSFAQRSDMMYYWARNNQQKAEDRAVAFAYAFCGVRIQCAQCHKHPFDKWSKRDFDQFERLFEGIEARQNRVSADAKQEFDSIVQELGMETEAKGNKLAKAIQDKYKGTYAKTIPFPEVYMAAKNQKQANAKNAGKGKGKGGKNQTVDQTPPARLLGGEFVDLATVSDPRETLMAWLRQKNNPYFAKALVNRVWAHYFQVGIVNPPDDLNLANAPSNQELLDMLSTGFIESGFDFKWLHRTIVLTDTYQRTWRTTASNANDRHNFSHALLRRLPAETAYDAIKIAVSNESTANSLCNLEVERAITMAGSSPRSRGKGDQYALSVFGRSVRESNCDCDRTSDPSLLQTVFIRNDADVLNAMSNPKSSWLGQVAREKGWPMIQVENSKNEKQKDAAKMMSDIDDPDQKLADDLDRQIRSLKIRIQRLNENDDEEKKRSELQTKLAHCETKLIQQLEKLSAKAELSELQDKQSESYETANLQAKSPREQLIPIIEEAYLRTLSRKPTDFEVNRSQNAIVDAETPTRGLSDLLWALINSKEFILNH